LTNQILWSFYRCSFGWMFLSLICFSCKENWDKLQRFFLTGNLLDRLQGHQKTLLLLNTRRLQRTKKIKWIKIIQDNLIKDKNTNFPRYQKLENKWPFNWKEILSVEDNYVKNSHLILNRSINGWSKLNFQSSSAYILKTLPNLTQPNLTPKNHLVSHPTTHPSRQG
jgi:hypothetical protein